MQCQTQDLLASFHLYSRRYGTSYVFSLPVVGWIVDDGRLTPAVPTRSSSSVCSADQYAADFCDDPAAYLGLTPAGSTASKVHARRIAAHRRKLGLAGDASYISDLGNTHGHYER